MVFKTAISFLTVFVLASLTRAHANDARHPGFDCATAKQPVEMVVCSDPGLMELDRRMAGEFRKIIDRSPAELVSIIRAEQRQWLKQRNDIRETSGDDRFFDATEPALFFSLERPEIEVLLIDHGVDVNQTNAFGKTALMYAAHLNLYESLDRLIKAKAAINVVNTDGPSNYPTLPM